MPRLLLVSTVSLTLRSFLLPYARHFRGKGWRVDAAAQGVREDPTCMAAFDECHELPWRRSLRSFRNLTAAAALRRLVKSGAYEIVHLHTPIAGFMGRLALTGSQASVVYTAHGLHFHAGGTSLTNGMFALAERVVAAATDFLVVINEEDELAARHTLRYSSDRIMRMPGIGVDLGVFRPGAVAEGDIRRVREEFGIGDGDKILLTVAELNSGKRHADALDAIAKLERDDFHVVFAGDGPMRAALTMRIMELGLERRVHMPGYRTDVPVLLAAAHAMVFPSEREGLPRSVMEAMAVGVPVIGALARGTRDLIAGGAGFGFNVGDTTALAQQIDTVLSSPDKVSGVVKRARERVAECRLERILLCHETLYQRTLSKRGGGR